MIAGVGFCVFLCRRGKLPFVKLYKSLKMLSLQCFSWLCKSLCGIVWFGGFFLFIWVFGVFCNFGKFSFLFFAECCLLWQRPVETVVHFGGVKFYEMQNALKKITPETP